MTIYDITPGIINAKIYPGDLKPVLEKVNDISNGDGYNLSNISMCLHNGAHIDAPKHFVEDGQSIDDIEPSTFIGSCYVVSASGPITALWVEENLPWDCERLLIKTNGDGYLMENAATELARFNLKLIGIDSLSIANESNEGAVHRSLMYENISILEGIDLSEVEDGRYFLSALPLKIEGAEAAPCRAILIKDIAL